MAALVAAFTFTAAPANAAKQDRIAVLQTYFGPQTPVNDFDACAGLQPAVSRSHAIPPQTGFFSALINWLHGG